MIYRHDDADKNSITWNLNKVSGVRLKGTEIAILFENFTNTINFEKKEDAEQVYNKIIKEWEKYVNRSTEN